MKKDYRVLIRETLKCYVDVSAYSRDEARKLVEDQVDCGEIVAPRDYDDFDRKVSVMRKLRGE